MSVNGHQTPRLSTGVAGLDNILHGGLPAGHVYLVEGDPGAGKTTMGMQFLIEGARRGERTLLVSLAESEEEIRDVAKSHGWDLKGVEIYAVSPPELHAKADAQYTVFHPAEVELADVMHAVLAKVETVNPSRVVVDSMSEFRMLAREPLRYRRQVLTLKQFFTGSNCTVLLLDDKTATAHDIQLQSIAHGVVYLKNLPREYGIKRRSLEVLKIRASKFREGLHDYVIETGGLMVFPRLVSSEHKVEIIDRSPLASGLKPLDDMFDGGINRGSSTLVTGPAGSGKSTLCAGFVASAAERGEPGVIFTFDEVRDSVLARSEGLGISLRGHVAAGLIKIEQIDPAELSPGEFVYRIRRGVEKEHWKVVVIDSLNGFLNAMSGEQAMTVQLHELIAYLNQVGVATFLVMAQYGILGHGMSNPLDVSYIADNVLLLRYFEAMGEVKQAISVVKRRAGYHERAIRELVMRDGAIRIGDPLSDFEGVLTGTPRYFGGVKPLL
jgi:circadian clock protein KaiC